MVGFEDGDEVTPAVVTAGLVVVPMDAADGECYEPVADYYDMRTPDGSGVVRLVPHDLRVEPVPVPPGGARVRVNADGSIDMVFLGAAGRVPPPTERVEVEPEQPPARTRAQSDPAPDRRPCENDLHLAVIYRHAWALERAMLAYAEADPPDHCPCDWCKDTDYLPWYLERFALQVELIKHAAETNLNGSVTRHEEARAGREREAERWADAERCARVLRALADADGSLTLGTRMELLRVAHVLEVDWRG